MTNINFLSLVEVCLSTNLRKLSRVITRLYDSRLELAGTNINQLAILLTIYGLNQQMKENKSDEFTSSTYVANKLSMETSTFSRNLRILEDQNLIEVIPSKINRKIKMIKLTDDGVKLVLKAYPYWDELQTKIKDDFGLDEFNNILTKLSQLETILQSISFN